MWGGEYLKEEFWKHTGHGSAASSRAGQGQRQTEDKQASNTEGVNTPFQLTRDSGRQGDPQRFMGGY